MRFIEKGRSRYARLLRLLGSDGARMGHLHAPASCGKRASPGREKLLMRQPGSSWNGGQSRLNCRLSVRFEGGGVDTSAAIREPQLSEFSRS